MRALPILTSLLLAAPLAANAAPSLTQLQNRCTEQERQIRQLEEENGRLKSLISSGKNTATTEAPKTAEPSAPDKDADKPAASGPVKVTVRDGDNWVKLARRNGTSAEALAKLNHKKTGVALRPGQEILVPSRDSALASNSSESKAASSSTHVVKEGETYYSIARHYGLGAEMLQDANPKIKANSLREGMIIRLGAGTVVAKSDAVAAKDDDKPSKKSIASKPQPKKAEKEDVAKYGSSSKEAPKAAAPAKREELASTQNNSADDEDASSSTDNQPVSVSKPRVHTVSIDREISFGGFAQAHGTSPEKLNALNGLTLNPSTVLAKGSELRVPAQP